MVFEHAQLLVAPPESFDSCIDVIKKQFIPSVSFSIVQNAQILLRGAGRIAILTRWPSEASAVSLLGTQQIKSIWSHLQVEFGVRLNGTQTREYSDPLIDIDDTQPEQVEDLTDDEYMDQMALQQAEQDAAAAKSGKFQPAFRFTFGRRIDGLYAVCVVTQRTYIPADLTFQFYEPVSVSGAEVMVPEAAFDELRRRLGPHAQHLSPYVDRQEWAGLVLRLFSLKWNDNQLEAALQTDRIAELYDYPLVRDPFAEDALLVPSQTGARADKRLMKLKARREQEAVVYVPIFEFLAAQQQQEEEAAAALLVEKSEESKSENDVKRPPALEIPDISSPQPPTRSSPTAIPVPSPSQKAVTGQLSQSPTNQVVSPSSQSIGPGGANLTSTVNARVDAVSHTAAFPSPVAATSLPVSPGPLPSPARRVPPTPVSVPPLPVVEPAPEVVVDPWGNAGTESARQLFRVSYEQGASTGRAQLVEKVVEEELPVIEEPAPEPIEANPLPHAFQLQK